MPCLVKVSVLPWQSARPPDPGTCPSLRIPQPRPPRRRHNKTQAIQPITPAPITPSFLEVLSRNSSAPGGSSTIMSSVRARGGISIGREPEARNHVLGFPVQVTFAVSNPSTRLILASQQLAVASDVGSRPLPLKTAHHAAR